jgi:molecular chaperone DnaK
MSIDQGRHALGVDFGTSNTVAVARWPDGRARPIIVDGSPLLPSAVYAEPDGMLLAGRDAVHSARRDPARFEPNPKRRIDDDLVLLGEREIPVVDLIAAVLVRVAEEWHRAVGPVRPDVTLTCPATWGATRRGLLAEAAGRAGLERARLVAEPVAAATYFAEVLGRDVPIGSVVVVHDFGAGTFDASVVARTAEGFEVLAVDGRDDVGGLDIDAAIVEHLGKICAERDPQAWQRLVEPATLEDRRAQRQLWDDARIAKERLSRSQSADVMIPLLDVEMHVTRDELEQLARPILDQTVQVTSELLRWADLPEGRLAGVFLVGGASRIPLVATLLHRTLGEAPVVIEQPELVVAEGSVLAGTALLTSEPAAPGRTSELRLVSRDAPPERPAPVAVTETRPAPEKIDDMETVPQSRRELTGNPGAGGPAAGDLAPAVDPWPDAQHHWVQDPEATVAAPISPPRPYTPPATTGPATTRSAATTKPPVTTRPRATTPPRSYPSAPATTPPRSYPSPPVAAARPGAASRTRPMTPQPPQPRRTGRGLRAFQLILSILVLVAVPLGALLATYTVTAGVPWDASITWLIEDLRRLLS